MTSRFNGLLNKSIIVLLVPNCYSQDMEEVNRLMSAKDTFFALSDDDILYMNSHKQANAFFDILSAQDAEAIFIELLNTSRTAVGEFYALLGLFETNKNCYHEMLKTINISKNIKVKTTPHSDWLVPVSSLGEIIVLIENGRWLIEMKKSVENTSLDKIKAYEDRGFCGHYKNS